MKINSINPINPINAINRQSDSYQPETPVKPKKASKLLTVAVLLGTSITSFAVLPTFDAINEKTQLLIFKKNTVTAGKQFFEQMEKWREQMTHAKQVWGKLDEMRGNWKAPLERLTDVALVKIIKNDEVRDLSRMGWEIANGRNTQQAISDQADKALERIEKAMSSQSAKSGADSKFVRDDLYEIYGETPATRPDVEMAHRTIARAMSSISQINNAIDEQRKQIESWKQRVSGGGLVPGDLERYNTLITAAQQDISLLQTRAQTIAIEIQTVQTGLTAASISDQETGRQRALAEAAGFAAGTGQMNRK